MDHLIGQMAEKAGISEEQAKMVVEFLKEHGTEVVAALSKDGVGGAVDAVKDKLPGGLGGMFGG